MVSANHALAGVSSAIKRVGQLATRPINKGVDAILKKPTSRTLCLLSRSRRVLASDAKLGRWSAHSRQHSSMMPYLQSTPGRSLYKCQRLVSSVRCFGPFRSATNLQLVICVDN